jgi:RimJ/RimL family protein N-acetyltransferase
MKIEPVTLDGRHVRLEPLSPGHHAGLCEFGLDEEIWRWYVSSVHTPDEMRAYIEAMLDRQMAGSTLPFAIVEQSSARLVGSTCYLNIDRAHRRLEIGSTWLGRDWQRTPVNTECKYLLLRHAFEGLGCIRVEFKTDSLNQRSRDAILRLGAKEEGTFRNHMITAEGRVRHSVYYSIIESEWPAVRARLEAMLARAWPVA